jgi:hypothetical protein
MSWRTGRRARASRPLGRPALRHPRQVLRLPPPPGISYRDYAIRPTRFHWQTQNAASPETAAGRRYLESADNGWTFQLFVRARKGDAYRACGPVYLADPAEDVSGSRPMNLEWTLRVPLPAELFGAFSVLRG